MSANTSMPEDLGRHAEVVDERQQPTPKALISVVVMRMTIAQERLHVREARDRDATVRSNPKMPRENERHGDRDGGDRQTPAQK